MMKSDSLLQISNNLKTTSVTTHFQNEKNLFIVSVVIVKSNFHSLQFLHQMFGKISKNSLENRSILDEVKAYQNGANFFAANLYA